MPKKIDFLTIYGKVVCDNFGFNPTSNSTKPLSIANSLFRNCWGKYCDIKDIHEWVVGETRKSNKVVSSEIIRDKYKDILVYGDRESIDDIREARYLLEQIYDPDSTAYASYQHSVLNIPSKWLIRDELRAEAHIGDFIFDILKGINKENESGAISIIRMALKDDEDDISRLIKPILTSSYKERIQNFEVEKREVNFNNSKMEIKSGFDNLAVNIAYRKQETNSLLVLKRMTNFSMFATFFYLVDINHAEFGHERTPILLDSMGELKAIERASEMCFTACKKSVESYIINLIERIIQNEQIINDANNHKECRAFLESMPLYKYESKGARTAILQYYDTFLEGELLPIRALARALQFAIYTFVYPNNTPSDFCRVLGLRSGLIGPSNARFKRFLVNQFLLETVVLSVLSSESLSDGIELRELGRLMREKYCIVIGTDTDLDYTLLEKAGIAQEAPEDLRGELAENAYEIANMLISMGLAKRYADGVTVVGWGL